jgi:hypothetical protein
MKTINLVKVGLIVLVLSTIGIHIFQSIYIDTSFETIMYYFVIITFTFFSVCFWALMLHVFLNWAYKVILKYFNVK